MTRIRQGPRSHDPRQPRSRLCLSQDPQDGRDDDWDIVSVNGSYLVDDTIRFEHPREDLEAISTGVGLAFDATRLPHEKNMSTTRKSYAVPDYYDSETIEVVRQRLGWMFERFGYPTEPSEDMRL